MNINGQKAKAWTHELRLGQLATQWWDPWPKGPGDSECWGEWKTSKSKAVWGSKESPQRIKNFLVITGNKLHWIFTLKGSGKNSFTLKTLSLGVMIICLKLPCGGCYFKYLCVYLWYPNGLRNIQDSRILSEANKYHHYSTVAHLQNEQLKLNLFSVDSGIHKFKHHGSVF